MVSVIVISYNSSAYILETLESIRTQTYRNIELIICDDCSKDNTTDIAKSWLNKNAARFVSSQLLVARSNGGIPANCNRGYNVASGDYVKLIAADDVLLDHCLTDSIKMMVYTGAEFLYAHVEVINSKSETVLMRKSKFHEFFYKLSLEKRLEVYCRNTMFLNTPTWVLKKELIDRLGGFDESYFLLEDTVLLIKCLQAKANIVFLDKEMVRYRVHEESSTHAKRISPIYGEIKRAREEKRLPLLNLYNPKNLLYLIDDYMYWSLAVSNRSRILSLIRLLNPAVYFKRIIYMAPNKGLWLSFKRMLA